MIKEYSLILLEKALNQALLLDPASVYKMRALEGKSLKLIIAPLDAYFIIRFEQDQLKLFPFQVEEPDTIIRSSPLGLIRLSFLPPSKARSLFNDQVKISGDVSLGEKIKDLFGNLDIDWEGHIAHFTGDIVAYKLGSFYRKGKALKHQWEENFCQNVSDYLQDELQLVIGAEELQDFCEDIDKLALEVERIAARLHLEKTKHART